LSFVSLKNEFIIIICPCGEFVNGKRGAVGSVGGLFGIFINGKEIDALIRNRAGLGFVAKKK
jgi:hypothetical protein